MIEKITKDNAVKAFEGLAAILITYEAIKNDWFGMAIDYLTSQIEYTYNSNYLIEKIKKHNYLLLV